MRNRIKGTLSMASFDIKNCPDSIQERPQHVSKVIEEQEESPISIDEFHRKYDELEILGEGGAAVVKKCMQKATNKVFAVKIMRNYDQEKEMASKSEHDLLKGIPGHPGIIKTEEFIATERWTYTVMEFANGQEL